MSETEKLNMLAGMTAEKDRSVLLTYLNLAGERVCRKAYPFKPECHEVPEKYAYVQIECAAYLLNKRGAEGETYHSENVIQRTYEAASIPDSMLKAIVPSVGVF